MDFLGAGPLELFFIFLIALIVLGPNDMVKAGKTLGRFLRRVVTSPSWLTFQQTSRELRNMPSRLMREAGLEELDRQKLSKEMGLSDLQKDLHNINSSLKDWTTTPPVPPNLPPTPPPTVPPVTPTLPDPPTAPPSERDPSA